ncbi:MAG: glycosyltransferase family 2 protein [Pseudomonadota bacterium]
MSQPRERLTVIIPCLNEEGNIAATVRSVYALESEVPVDLEVLVIDDGSTDGTAEVLRGLAQRFPLRIVTNERNLGMGRSVLNAYELIAPGSWITVLPGDNEIDARSILSLLEHRERYDLVLGYLGNPVIRPAGRRAASWAFTTFAGALYGFDYRYLNGLKLYRVEVFKGIEVFSSGHAYTAELIAKAILRRPGLRVGEAPFIARGRGGGQSKAIRPRAVLTAVREVWAGHRSVSRYRREVIEGAGRSGPEGQ